jgi:hypothetical protein
MHLTPTTTEGRTMIETLTQIPFKPQVDALMQRAHVKPGTEDAAAFAALIERARPLACPKALYRESFVQGRDGDSVCIDDITFTSRALRLNLNDVVRVFPYVATCGKEMDQVELPAGDYLAVFWWDVIKGAALEQAIQFLNETLQRRYLLGNTSRMNPGSGDAAVWPIEQQRQLFGLLGDVEQQIGVQLTDWFLMVPNKTVSGLIFPTEVEFRACQVCHREACPNRRAPFDPDLWESIQER